MDNCQTTSEKTEEARPTCDDCRVRVDWALDTFRDPVVIDYWVRELQTSTFCNDTYGDWFELCQSYVPVLVPELLMMSSGNDWVPAFCKDFGCKDE